MDENNNQGGTPPAGREGRPSGSRRRRRPRQRRRKPAEGAAPAREANSAPSRNQQNPSNPARRRRSTVSTPAASGGTNPNKKRKRRLRKRGGGGEGNRQKGTLIDATGRLIRQSPPPASIVDREAELELSGSRFRDELVQLKSQERNCSVCGNRIDDVMAAVPFKDGKGLCHLECVQASILKQEKLEENETLVYIGSGEYAIYQERKNRGKVYLFFRKRIPYQERTNHRNQG